jgi:hypothetical protein
VGKVFGFLALIFGIIGLVSMGLIAIIIYPFSPYGEKFCDFIIYVFLIGSIVCPFLALICSAIGFKRDDSPGLARAGFALGIPAATIVISIFVSYILTLMLQFLSF